MRILLYCYNDLEGPIELDLPIAKHPNADDLAVGTYEKLGGRTVTAFVIDKDLYLGVDDKYWLFDSIQQMTFNNDDKESELRITVPEQEIVIKYVSREPISVPCYTEDDVDTDFGLFVSQLQSQQYRNLQTEAWRKWAKQNKSDPPGGPLQKCTGEY